MACGLRAWAANLCGFLPIPNTTSTTMNPSRNLSVYAGIAAGLCILAAAPSKQTGILPGDVIQSFNVGSLTRQANVSCGQCHQSPPQAVAVSVKPAQRVLPAGTTTNIALSGTSSQAGTLGGFCADVTAGTLVAGAGTRTNAAGTAATHTSQASRAWSLTWRAPTQPGLVELYTVHNHVNGNRQADPGDLWAFHGASPTANTSTPVRLYANASGNVAIGDSCPDGFGNYSVLGSPEVPSVGNTNYKLEVFGAAPSAPMLLMVGTGAPLNLDMGFMGAPGCVLQTNMLLQAVVQTGPGNAARAEGSFTLPVPIPNQQALRGSKLLIQFGFVDANSQRSFSFTTTNGLELTVQ